MVRSHGKVTKTTQARVQRSRVSIIVIFWTVLAVLSISITSRTAYAQTTGVVGGTLGGLLEQLQSLKEAGAIDQLEGRGQSKLDLVRKKASEKVEALKNRKFLAGSAL